MNYYSFISLISFFVCIYLAAMVFYRNPDKDLNRVFALFSLILSLWGLCEFIERIVTDVETFIFWNNINSFWPFAAASLLHFTLIFTERKKFYLSRIFLIFIYGQALAVSAIDLLYIRPSNIVIVKWGFRSIHTGSSGYLNIITDVWGVLIGILIVLMSIHYRFTADNRNKQKQAQLVSIGLLIFIITSIMTETILPELFSNFSYYIPSLSPPSFVLAAVFIGYSIWKYQLFILTAENAADEIIETMSDILILTNPDGKITRVNQAAQNALGYNELQLFNNPLEQLVPAGTDFLFRGRGLSDLESTLKTMDGRIIPVSLSASILYDRNENVQGYVIICRDRQERMKIQEELDKYKGHLEDLVVEQTTDILRVNKSLHKEIAEKESYEEMLHEKNRELTAANEELKAALEELEATNEEFEAQNEELLISSTELQKSEAFQKSIFKSAPTGIGVVINRKFTYINKLITDMTGFTQDDLIGKDARMVYPTDEDYEFVGREKYRQISSFGSGTVETRWLRKDGQIIDVLLSSSPIDPDDLSTGVTFSVLDISDRKITEKRLIESEEHFRKMIENSPVGIGISDREKNITYINNKFTEIFGYTIEDIPHLDSWWEIAYPDKNYREVVMKSLGAAIKESRKTGIAIEPQEWEIISKNGSVKHIQIHMTPIGDLTFTVLNDLTEKKQAENFLIQTEKMMTVGGLAAGMAHEINNPLGVIMQGVQITLNRLSPENSKNVEIAVKSGTSLEKIREYLKERKIFHYLEGIRDAGNRATDIITNMLQFSRRSGADKAPVDIHPVIEKAIDIASKDYDLENKYDFRNISIKRNYYEHLDKVPCNKTEIQQVILNLLKNASHAMSEVNYSGYRPVIYIKTYMEDNFAVIEITDNGPGIKKDILNRIFEPFYSTKDVGQGTGLGLSVSYFIITNNHGGFITAESEPGAGANFIIKLPLK